MSAMRKGLIAAGTDVDTIRRATAEVHKQESYEKAMEKMGEHVTFMGVCCD